MSRWTVSGGCFCRRFQKWRLLMNWRRVRCPRISVLLTLLISIPASVILNRHYPHYFLSVYVFFPLYSFKRNVGEQRSSWSTTSENSCWSVQCSGRSGWKNRVEFIYSFTYNNRGEEISDSFQHNQGSKMKFVDFCYCCFCLLPDRTSSNTLQWKYADKWTDTGISGIQQVQIHPVSPASR